LAVSKKRRVAADTSRPAAGAVDLAQAEAAPPAPAPHASAPAVGTSATVQEKLANLQHPDAEHLQLGINLEGLREACELVGFPYTCYKDGLREDAWAGAVLDSGYGNVYTYMREDHPEMAWVDEAYPRDLYKSLGYDFCCAIKVWLKANGHENKSICQVLLERGSKNVGRANVFYSHTQGVWLRETIKRMREAIETHKAQLPQASEKAKALAAKQRARVAELPALIEAAWFGKKWWLRRELEGLRNKPEACPADESHLFFWLGVPPPPPKD